MDLIKCIQDKLSSIDDKQGLKIDFINKNFKKDCEQINNHLLNLEKYKNGLNVSRDEMLKLMIAKRDEQLKEISGFNFIPNKLNNFSFYPSLISIFEHILYRSKFENSFNINQLAKYSKFMTNQKEYGLQSVKNTLPIKKVNKIYKLTSNSILLCCDSTEMMQSYLVIMNKNGNVVNFLKLKPSSRIIRVNKTNIISFSDSKVEIFNFDLNLVHEILLEKFKFQDFKLNNYEMGFVGFDYFVYKARLTFFDYKSLKFRKKSNKSEFDIGLSLILDKYKQHIECDQLVHLDLIEFNENYVFISTELAYQPVFLFVFSRTSAECLLKYEWNARLANLFVYDCTQICILDDRSHKMCVYNINCAEKGNDCETIEVKEEKFLNLYFRSSNKHFRDEALKKNNLEFIILNEY